MTVVDGQGWGREVLDRRRNEPEAEREESDRQADKLHAGGRVLPMTKEEWMSGDGVGGKDERWSTDLQPASPFAENSARPVSRPLPYSRSSTHH